MSAPTATFRRRLTADYETELTLVASLLESGRACDAATDAGFTPADLHDPILQTIATEALEMHDKGRGAAPELVAARLRRRGEDAAARITQTAFGAGLPAPVVADVARDVIAFAQLRQVASAAEKIRELVMVDDETNARTVLERAEQIAVTIGEREQARDFVGLRQLLGPLYDRWSDAYERGGAITGLPTGLDELDEILGGLQPSSLVILGARPGMGKTSMALGIAEHVAFTVDKSVAIFSMEMDEDELATRAVASLASVNAKRLKLTAPQAADFERINKANERVFNAPERIHIDPSPSLTPAELRRKARRLKKRLGGNLALVLVDYLQLMEAGKKLDGRVAEVTYLSRQLKRLAMELKLPVLALSQLNRGIETRGENARPRLSDLRESGSVEQDADVVVFLWNTPDAHDVPGERVTVTALVEKNRHGAMGLAPLKFEPQYTRFVGRSIMERARS